MIDSQYKNAIITENFEEIVQKCNGDFEKTEKYKPIIQRQIEKMFISSSLDTEFQETRQEFRLYPIMLLYKVLLELGRSTGNYSVSLPCYKYIIATTKKFEDFLDTLVLIKVLNENTSVIQRLEDYRTKFDNRILKALEQLPTLIIDNNSISLNTYYINEIAQKVFIFESNPNNFTKDDYLDFLCSKMSLIDLSTGFCNINKPDDIDQFSSENFATERKQGGTNIILYGVPGSGKSWTIKHDYCNDESQIERIVFHPDFTYSDFIGQILPTIDDSGCITYEFSAGPFTKLLRKAYLKPDKMFFLIIEEINRGNAPAIFGDIFQLLDRDNAGNSEYRITNDNIAQIVYNNKEHKVSIPSNMSIICTMNTCDQNVFTLDTAFQRRWNMRLIKNKFFDNDTILADTQILDTKITWKHFFTKINSFILENCNQITSAEDRRLGTHFVSTDDLNYKDGNTRQISKFPEKVLKYLWDDAFKFSRENIFDLDKVTSLEDVIEFFVNNKSEERFKVFKENIYNTLIDNNL